MANGRKGHQPHGPLEAVVAAFAGSVALLSTAAVGRWGRAVVLGEGVTRPKAVDVSGLAQDRGREHRAHAAKCLQVLSRTG